MRFLIRMEWPGPDGRTLRDWCGRGGWHRSPGNGLDKAEADDTLELFWNTPGLVPGTTFTPEAVEE